jgi:integrase
MRLNEIRCLQHDWIDHERKTVTLPQYVCKNRRGGTVPCTQRFLDAVSAMPRHYKYPQVLFSERSKGPYCRFQLETWWVGIRERAGVQAAPGDGTVHLHDLRAGAATNALERGVRLETVSRRILRHSTLATTEVYLRGREVGNLEQAIEAMEAGILRDQEKRKGPKRANVDFDADASTEHLPIVKGP